MGKRKRSEQLQAKLVGHYRAGRRKYIKEHEFESKESIARMESRANKGSALLWKTYPLTQDFALSDEDIRFSVAYATGQRLPHMPAQCGCASRARLTIEHTVNCAEKLTRHNMLQSRFVSFARLHGVTTRQNPRLSCQEAKERLEPDVIFYPGAHEPVQTDITVVNSCTLRIEEEPICTQVGYQRTEGEEATEVPPESNSSRRAVSSSDLRDAWQDFRGSGSHPGHAGLQDVNGLRAGENRHEVGSSGYFGEGQCARRKIDDCVGAKSTGQRTCASSASGFLKDSDNNLLSL